MPLLSLGTIEVLGLPAAVAAADVACKTADVTLIGYETTDGMGMVAVKIEGQVSAVQSAVAAARAAASQITRVFATSVIPRPSAQLDPVVLTDVTVGLERPGPEPVVPAEAAPEPEPVTAAPEPIAAAPEPIAQPEPEPVTAAPEPTVEPGPVAGAPAKPPVRRRTTKPRAPKPNPTA